MESFEANLNTLLVDAFNYVLRYEEQSLKSIASMPTTVTEAHILEVVGKRADMITVSEIASALHIAVPTATVAIKKLENKGLVTKTTCADDARRTLISLTPQGKRVDRAHNLFHLSMVSNISVEFTDDEKEVLLRAIQKLNSFFKVKVGE
jgi:DNA-binding MarR family transcriptional regulator